MDMIQIQAIFMMGYYAAQDKHHRTRNEKAAHEAFMNFLDIADFVQESEEVSIEDINKVADKSRD